MRRTTHKETRERAAYAAASEAPQADTSGAEIDVGEQAAPQPAEDAVAALQERVAELETNVADLTEAVRAEHEQYLRTLADFQNFRRRNDEQRAEERRFANRELIIGLLPILDNFERALAAAETTKSYDALVDGVALTMRQLKDDLAKQGVEAIEALGAEFDPNLHEAVLRVEDSEHPDNTVVEEVQRGYRMGSRVLRPSMVKVARSE